ncbi:MAG: GGDEF domain-containing protein [Fibrobacteria bacterium]|nr:GGDEF domain-containing protein [Fibrobacteria bacterium]
MQNILKITGTVLLLAGGIAGIQYLPSFFLSNYRPYYLGIMTVIALLFFVLANKSGEKRALDFYPSVALLLVTAIIGIQLLGGLTEGWNSGILLFVCILICLSANSLVAVLFMLYTWIGYSALYFDNKFELLPYALNSLQTINLFDYGFHLALSSISGLLVLVTNELRIKHLPGRDVLLKLRAYEAGAIPQKVSQDSSKDQEHKTEHEFTTQEYFAEQEKSNIKKMKSQLETLVFFMGRNFNAYSALCFVATGDTGEFYLAASTSKSENLVKDVRIKKASGIVGMASRKKMGFFSGDIKSYPGKIEYYSKNENINSVMALPINDTENDKVIGLLVADAMGIRAFSDEHKELLSRFTQIAAAMITNARLTEEVNKQAKWADSLYETTKRLTKFIKVEDVVGLLGDSLSTIFINDRIVICIFNPKTGKARIWNVVGDKAGVNRGDEFDINNPKSLYGRVFKTKEEVFIHHYRDMNDYVRFEEEEENPFFKPEEMLIVPLLDDKNNVITVVGVESNEKGMYSDRELKMLSTLKANFATSIVKAKIYNELERLATIDGLTQINNHRKFQEALSSELYRTQRYKEKLSLLLMDIDHFKKFNDTYGHPIGDVVLKKVAATIKQTVRTSDLVARYGGEEFVVIVTNADEIHSVNLAKRINKAIDALEIEHEGKILKVQVSIGSATFPTDVFTKQELIDGADKALYYAKEHGRNQVAPFSLLLAEKNQEE